MLEVRDISVWFGTREVIDGVSLDLAAGRIIVLLGPNGAGKTSLLRALNGTVATKSGGIKLDGIPLPKLSRREIARNITVVAQ